MIVVDPHVHFWNSSAVRYPWLANPRESFSGDNRRLPAVYEPASLLLEAGTIAIGRTVHVEANPENSLAEVAWLQALADSPASAGNPHGIVAHVDLCRPDLAEYLQRLCGYRNVRGVRQILNVHANPRYDYVGRDLLLDARWRRGLTLLAAHGLSFDLQLYPAQIPSALRSIRANPQLLFVIDHTGMFVDRTRPGSWREWRDGLRSLARADNTVIKISGLAMFDHAWTIESIRPYVLETLDTFGVRRCMFASNSPIDRLHREYSAIWTSFAAIVAEMRADEIDALFVSNAVRHYRLPPI